MWVILRLLSLLLTLLLSVVTSEQANESKKSGNITSKIMQGGVVVCRLTHLQSQHCPCQAPGPGSLNLDQTE